MKKTINKDKRAYYPKDEHELCKVMNYLYSHNEEFSVISEDKKVRQDSINIISLENMDKIIEHRPKELCVKVQPGVPVDKLNSELEKEGQEIPCNYLLKKRGSVGGMVAGNWSSPSAEEEGYVKDIILGSRMITPDGKIITDDNIVAKNVTGYNITKAMVGSQGKFVIYSQINLKTRPKIYKRFLKIKLDELKNNNIYRFCDNIILSTGNNITLYAEFSGNIEDVDSRIKKVIEENDVEEIEKKELLGVVEEGMETILFRPNIIIQVAKELQSLGIRSTLIKERGCGFIEIENKDRKNERPGVYKFENSKQQKTKEEFFRDTKVSTQDDKIIGILENIKYAFDEKNLLKGGAE